MRHLFYLFCVFSTLAFTSCSSDAVLSTEIQRASLEEIASSELYAEYRTATREFAVQSYIVRHDSEAIHNDIELQLQRSNSWSDIQPKHFAKYPGGELFINAYLRHVELADKMDSAFAFKSLTPAEMKQLRDLYNDPVSDEHLHMILAAGTQNQE